MASGLTHILLTKKLQDNLPEGKLKNILAYATDSLQVGAVGPDLPYASIADNDFFFANESSLADSFHYQKTNQIPIKALRYLKTNQEKIDEELLFHMFSFFIGYTSHVLADGIIHPYVRDKVGDYAENQEEHRSLEMQLDVLFFAEFTRSTGLENELNYTKIHEELLNFTESGYSVDILKVFRRLIEDIYGERYSVEKILGWVKGLYRMFNVAEGDHPKFYRILESNSFTYRNIEDIDKQKALVLTKPKDRELNFLSVNKIDFFDDCVPKYYEKFIPLTIKAFEYVFEDGDEVSELDIPLIDLDTGRLLVNNKLELIPEFWK